MNLCTLLYCEYILQPAYDMHFEGVNLYLYAGEKEGEAISVQGYSQIYICITVSVRMECTMCLLESIGFN